ncbi:MAG: hypothetical protein ACREIG_07120 [Nitrospiraceae bacterium]
MSKDLTPPSEPALVDDVAKVGGAMVIASVIPGVGPVIAEIWRKLYELPYEQARDRFLHHLAAVVEELRQRPVPITIDQLAADPPFITTLHRITEAAARDQREEKLRALRAAVINTAAGNAPDLDIRLMFIRFVDQLTATHLRILSFFRDPAAWFKEARPEEYGSVAFSTRAERSNWPDMIELAYSDLRNERGVLRAYIRHLVNEDLLQEMFEIPPDRAVASATTHLGDQFLTYISEAPLPPPIKGKGVINRSTNRTLRFVGGPRDGETSNSTAGLLAVEVDGLSHAYERDVRAQVFRWRGDWENRVKDSRYKDSW